MRGGNEPGVGRARRLTDEMRRQWAAAKDGHMSVHMIRGSIVVRDERPHPAWSAGYVVIGMFLVWISLANADAGDIAPTYVGLAVGLLFAGPGLTWLMPGKIVLQIDPAARRLRAFNYGFLGRCAPAQIDSAAY